MWLPERWPGWTEPVKLVPPDTGGLFSGLRKVCLIAGMINRTAALFATLAWTVLAGHTDACAQTLTCAEIQGQADVSPYEGQEVTVSAKVTDYFGDVWYIQDDFGAWNGVMCIGPNVIIEANPPWWNAPRQPEVGDVMELTGTIVEVDGNTQLMDITDFVFIDYWNATAAGTGCTIEEMMDESLEGTRVRLDPVTVMSAPEGGVWTASDATGTVTIIGLDTDDPSNNEDPDGPTPGDVYRVYGSVRQIGAEYVVDLSDIDTLSLVVGLQEEMAAALSVHPVPTSDVLHVQGWNGAQQWQLIDAMGRTLQSGNAGGAFDLDLTSTPKGRYFLSISQGEVTIRKPVIVD